MFLAVRPDYFGDGLLLVVEHRLIVAKKRERMMLPLWFILEILLGLA